MNTKTVITKSMLLKIMGIARVIFFILGVVICVSTNRFFSGCKKPQQPATTSVPVSHDATIACALVPYERRLSEMQLQNAELRTQMADIENALSRTKRKAASLEQKLQRQIDTGKNLSDTVALLDNCDTLQQTNSLLMQQPDKLIISATTLITSLLFYSYARASGRDDTALVMIGAFTGSLIGEALAEQMRNEGTNGNKTTVNTRAGAHDLPK